MMSTSSDGRFFRRLVPGALPVRGVVMLDHDRPLGETFLAGGALVLPHGCLEIGGKPVHGLLGFGPQLGELPVALSPGDLIGFGISHPCTTFDKWRVIPVVDDEYRVIDAVRTFF